NPKTMRAASRGRSGPRDSRNGSAPPAAAGSRTPRSGEGGAGCAGWEATAVAFMVEGRPGPVGRGPVGFIGAPGEAREGKRARGAARGTGLSQGPARIGRRAPIPGGSAARLLPVAWPHVGLQHALADPERTRGDFQEFVLADPLERLL